MNHKFKIVHFSDLHFGSGERYGTINPESGLNRRFEDFISALEKPVNFALDNKVDLVLFTGDTYKHAVPEPIYQKEFAKRIKLLSASGISTVLLVGNHDVLYRVDGSHALEIYKTLDVEHVTVFDKIELKQIATNGGPIQIISLPHITKSRLLTKEEYRGLSAKEQDQLMLEKVKHALFGCMEKLDTSLPAILIGHGTIESAQFGSEQDLSIGKVLSYPISYFKKPELNYVGFGHIHRHQILEESPLILYAGSLERVDFGEEKEDKGFVYLEIQKGNPLVYKFISSNPREFITIECDLTKDTNSNLQEVLENEINKKFKKGAIIRIRFKISEENADVIDLGKVKALLKDSFSHVIQPEILKKERSFRMSGVDSTLTSNPIIALEKFLYDVTDEEKSDLVAIAQELLQELNSERK